MSDSRLPIRSRSLRAGGNHSPSETCESFLYGAAAGLGVTAGSRGNDPAIASVVHNAAGRVVEALLAAGGVSTLMRLDLETAGTVCADYPQRKQPDS